MTEAKQNEIRENIARIREDMADYPNAALMAVIKTRKVEEINFAIRECGITLVGENRVQELLAHYEGMDRSAKLHFIGNLQKNKVKYIPGAFNKFLNFVMKLLPKGIVLRFIARRWKKQTKDAF